MNKDVMQKLIEVITDSAIPLQEQNETYDVLLDKIGDARFVMIGEASHGTHEFYQARIKITQRLIKERGFMAVAIEGDWPDAYHVHRYLQGKKEAVRMRNVRLIDLNAFQPGCGVIPPCPHFFAG